MDFFCLCGHATRDHDFIGGPGPCMVWLEEETDWCPCVEFAGRTGTNSTNITQNVTIP